MRPILFHLFGIPVPSFFFMMMIGALIGSFYAASRATKDGEDPVILLDMAMIGIVASVVGGRLFHVFVEHPAYYWEAPIRVFYFWQGGFVSIGSFLMGAIGWFSYFALKKLEPFKYIDIGLLGVPIVIFFTRVGCLLVGCCYGKPTDFFFHLTFNNPSSVAGHYHLGVPLHATQVYEMINAALMFSVLHLVYFRKKFHGQVGVVFLIYYGISRFLIEAFRGDADRGVYFDGAISSAQISVVGFIIAGLVLWHFLKDRKRIPPREPPLAGRF